MSLKHQTSRYKNQARNRKLDALIAEARAKPCADCGMIDASIMQLDHVPERGPKLFVVVRHNARRYGFTRLRAELLKVDPVCPNCHAWRGVARAAAKKGEE